MTVTALRTRARLLLRLATVAWWLVAPVALAALGNAPSQLLAQLGDYGPEAVEGGASYVAVDDFTFELEVQAGVVVAVTGRAPLNETNIEFLGALIGAASGYGDGISGPVADFFRARSEELVGGGELPIQVLEYDLTAAVQAGAPGEAAELSFRFEPQEVDESRFPTAEHVLGPADAQYVLRVFSDFQCPFCRAFALDVLPNIDSLLLSRGDVRFEFHHFPLKSIHPNAAAAGEASECAAAVGGEAGFWRFHDLLFEHQAEWARLADPAPAFAAFAASAVVDVEGFAACLASGTEADVVEGAYTAAASGLLLTGTPTVFLNGLKLGDYSAFGEYARLMRLSDALEAATLGDESR